MPDLVPFRLYRIGPERFVAVPTNANSEGPIQVIPSVVGFRNRPGILLVNVNNPDGPHWFIPDDEKTKRYPAATHPTGPLPVVVVELTPESTDDVTPDTPG